MRQCRAAERLRELHGWRRRGASASTFFWYDFEYCGWPLFCSPLRYRLHIPFATGYESMSPFRYRNEPPYIYVEEEEESASRNAIFIAIGAAAGFAAGVLMAERFGGFKGLTDRDRKSTRLNSSHLGISYAVFCLKKKNKHYILIQMILVNSLFI